MATTWAAKGSRSVKASCTSGTETPSAATDGMSLDSVQGYHIIAKGTGGNFGAGTLRAYIYESDVAAWVRAPNLDITLTTGVATDCRGNLQAYAGRGRIAYLPNGVTGPTSIEVWHLAVTQKPPGEAA